MRPTVRANTLMMSQSLAAQQTFRALLGVARSRLNELHRALEAATSTVEAATIRAQIANTRQAINMAEKIG